MEVTTNNNIKSIDLWHPIDGKWTHIVQEFSEDPKFYTNGKKEFPDKK